MSKGLQYAGTFSEVVKFHLDWIEINVNIIFYAEHFVFIFRKDCTPKSKNLSLVPPKISQSTNDR